MRPNDGSTIDKGPAMRSVRIALGIVNTSTAMRVDAEELRAALIDPAAPGQAHARILMEEAPEPLFADLVREGFLSWHALAEAAGRYPPDSHDTIAWIDDMARLALAGAAASRP